MVFVSAILEHDWQVGTDLTRSDQCHPANHVLWFVDQNLSTRQIGLGKAKNGNTEFHGDTQSFTEKK